MFKKSVNGLEKVVSTEVKKPVDETELFIVVREGSSCDEF